MKACESYLVITTFSLPALAIYDAGAALCRSIEKTNVTMYISVITNIINVIGNCIGVFALHLGATSVVTKDVPVLQSFAGGYQAAYETV